MGKTDASKASLVLRLVDLAALFVRFGMPWIMLVIASLILRDAIRSLSAVTDASQNIVIEFLTNVSRTRALAFIFGILGTAYGLQQRNLRLGTVARLRQRIAVLENALQTRELGE